MNNCDLDRGVVAKQSDEGIGDTFISIGATNGFTLLFSINASDQPEHRSQRLAPKDERPL